MRMLERIAASLDPESSNPALFFEGKYSSYGELALQVAAIQALIETQFDAGQQVIGVEAHSDIETYAALLAIILSGHAYLPVHPASPIERNQSILTQAGARLLLSSHSESAKKLASGCPGLLALTTYNLPFSGAPVLRSVPDTQLAYLLFTSGSTGVPKGVPITRGNLEAFLGGFFAAGVTLDSSDRVLQMFDLTFDFSVMSCFVPWVVGACLYPAAANEMKFMSVYRLLEEQHITCAPMVPSALTFLRPYFDEIQLPSLRYSVFCGEPLLANVAAEWSKCTPNAQLINFYGPTEATVFCSAYQWASNRQKAHNGALSIGRPMLYAEMKVVDESGKVLSANQSGEICLSGAHLTPGYWNDPQRSAQAFFYLEIDGKQQRFYRTGDLGFVDAEGDFMFQGRVDQQVKVQGFRIELGEIEHHARACVGVRQVVALALPARDGNTELVLCIEGETGQGEEIVASLRSKLPAYMVPTRVETFAAFPLNNNGKIDRSALRQVLAH